MKLLKFSFFISVFLSVFLSSIRANAQTENKSGAFCDTQSGCSAGYICDVTQSRCIRDFGGSDSVNIDKSEDDLRGQVKTYANKMLIIPFVILLGALVGVLFLIKKVFVGNSKAGIIKKMLVVALTVFIVISLVVVGFAWTVIRTVLDSDTVAYKKDRYSVSDQSNELDVSIIPKCGQYFNNSYQLVDKKSIDIIQKDLRVLGFMSQGYKLREICGSSNHIISFFDFSDGFWNSLGKVKGSELDRMRKKVIFGIMDNQLNNAKFYQFNIPSYRLEGTGGMACHVDKLFENQILYICYNGSDSGTSISWNAYDTEREKNIEVKYEFQGVDSSANKEEVYRPDLITLFSDV